MWVSSTQTQMLKWLKVAILIYILFDTFTVFYKVHTSIRLIFSFNFSDTARFSSFPAQLFLLFCVCLGFSQRLGHSTPLHLASLCLGCSSRFNHSAHVSSYMLAQFIKKASLSPPSQHSLTVLVFSRLSQNIMFAFCLYVSSLKKTGHLVSTSMVSRSRVRPSSVGMVQLGTFVCARCLDQHLED